MSETNKPSRGESSRQSSGNGYGYPKNYGPSGNGYGAPGYGGYGGGYGGYGGYGETTVQRSLQDYLLILRERIWYIVVAFVVIVAATAIYSFSQTPLFRSTATVQVFRRAPTVMQVQQVMDSEVRSAEDLNTEVNILKSTVIIERVGARLTPAENERFLAPYRTPKSPNPSIIGVLTKNRQIIPQRASLIVAIQYDHPDAGIAAVVANLFADEYINFSAKAKNDESLKAVRELEAQAKGQTKNVEDIRKEIQAYLEKNNLVSLEQRKDINTEKLKEVSTRVTQNEAALHESETRWKQVQGVRAAGGDLLTLSFIASEPAVNQLTQQVNTTQLKVAELSQHYRALWPDMIEANKSLETARMLLKSAIDTATAQVESSYKTALENYNRANTALSEQSAAALKLGSFNVDYENMEMRRDVNEKILQTTMARMRETAMSSSVASENARPLDHAVVGPQVSPNYRLNLGLGVIGGLGFGIALAFLVAFIDDRIKSTFDIEVVVGLPLLSIIPRFEKGPKGESTPNAFTPPSEREVVEAFSTLYSGMKVKEENKPVQCIVITSTVPGEGKSFIARNLAMTFAAHGDRVLLIDCDLRRPVVHRAFEMENLKGVIDVCAGTSPLDEVIVKEVSPNMDVLPSGGRSKNPAKNLSSKNFEVMLSDLRKRYDRIFIDTPPVALVSDALVILPLADGTIYSIFFNKVRRKAAQFCVQRMTEVNVTHFGAVLNGLDQNLGGYYYHHYYDKKYRGYYTPSAGRDE